MHLNMVFVPALLFIAMSLSGCQSLSTENRSSETQKSEESVHKVIVDVLQYVPDPKDSMSDVKIDCSLPADARTIVDQIEQFYKSTSSENNPKLLFSEQLMESFEYPGRYERLEKRLGNMQEEMKDCIAGFEIVPPSSHRHIYYESYRALYPDRRTNIKNIEESDPSPFSGFVLFPKIADISPEEGIQIRYSLVEYPSRKVNRIRGKLIMDKPTFDCGEMEQYTYDIGRIDTDYGMLEKRIKSTVNEYCKDGVTFQEIKECIKSSQLGWYFQGRIEIEENPIHGIISHAKSVCYDDNLI